MHLWQGEWIDHKELEQRLPVLGRNLHITRRFHMEVLLSAADMLSIEITHGQVPELEQELLQDGYSKQESTKILTELAGFLQRESLERKLVCELGSIDPFLMKRPLYTEAIYEAWCPLGVLVHVTTGNAPAMAALSVLEGLLSGNINIVKTSSKEGLFSLRLLKMLVDKDQSGMLGQFVYVFRISSSRLDLLNHMMAHADGVVAWGGEQAIRAIRELVPSGARLIEWGHKLSFAYVTAACKADAKVLNGLAQDICNLEQQACSSPQCIYLETDNRQQLLEFAESLAIVLDEVSAAIPRKLPGLQEQAEITTITELVRAGQCLEEGKLYEAADKSWRIFVDYSPALRPSPLYRSIWVKMIRRYEVIDTIRSMKTYLQTVGLAAGFDELEELSYIFTRAGVTRITRPGAMLSGYTGEPHDGEVALSRYCRRITAQPGDIGTIANFAELAVPVPPYIAVNTPVLTKKRFKSLTTDAGLARIYIRSGGSSGTPVFSGYSYEDYEQQMEVGADGLLAAGLDPRNDRCINLFFGNYMYGGTLSFFSILKKLGAVQFPMGAVPELDLVADAICQHNVNTLLGMPSYIMRLLQEQADILKQYGGVKKIFYGGEHFTPRQIEYLQQEFGIQIIRSGAYGSNDTGPMGFACEYCEAGVHHLSVRAQWLEILKLDRDCPVEGEEIGRLVFSSRLRQGQKVLRYEIGDLGCWIKEPCPCGRKAPRFKLLGRFGDIFRAGADFLNYRKICQIIENNLDYNGKIQLVLRQQNGHDLIGVCVEPKPGINENNVRDILLEHYAEIYRSIVVEGIMELAVRDMPAGEMIHTNVGKLRTVVDLRMAAGRF